MQKIAVFDIDGTLFNLHLGVEFLKTMSSLDAIHGISQHTFNKQYNEWLHTSEKTAYYDETFDAYFDTNLKGVAREDFDRAGQQVADQAFLSAYPEVMSELHAHQQDGRFIVLISKSPEQAVAKIAQSIHANAYWGWQFHFDASERYVNQCTYPNGESDKAQIIKHFVLQYDLSLDDSYAYGDSNGDISMLQLVSNPTVVNPEPKLLVEAQQGGWRVVFTKK